jgi:hypothetical protein
MYERVYFGIYSLAVAHAVRHLNDVKVKSLKK